MREARVGRRDPVAERAYRNRVAVLVVGGVFVTLAALYVVLLPSAQGALTGICAFAFLAAVSIALEYLMKPGYGFLHRRRHLEPEDPSETPDRPQSPGTP